MKKLFITIVAVMAIGITAQGQGAMKIELRDGRVISYPVEDINRFYFDDMKTEEDLAPNCEVSIIDELALPEEFAVRLRYGTEVEYVMTQLYTPRALVGLSDDVIIADLASGIRITPSQDIITAGGDIKEGTEYIMAFVGYNANGKHGHLYRRSITTTVAAEEPLAEIPQVLYNDVAFKYNIEVDDDAVFYYYLHEEVGNNIQIIPNTAEFGMLWRERIKNGVDDDYHVYGSEDNIVERPNGEQQLYLCTWCVDYDDHFYGNIFRGFYDISTQSVRNKLPANRNNKNTIEAHNYKEMKAIVDRMKLKKIKVSGQ